MARVLAVLHSPAWEMRAVLEVQIPGRYLHWSRRRQTHVQNRIVEDLG